ncbi:hypothetical protein BLNAU_24594 [Blattamonas nauphoetae]|uniref:Reverse transcriptase domain-containing protein n=1 Tax=Blattamonas nauphoetae TaxID=2049346 RepID=A0ABQ9WMV5_9EUKA|nr:hypothetical protein BLNAU_24594 [Blattamonas nauphoetae]
MEVDHDPSREMNSQPTSSNVQPHSGQEVTSSSVEIESQPPNGMECQSTSFDVQPPSGQEFLPSPMYAITEMENEKANEMDCSSVPCNAQPQNGPGCHPTPSSACCESQPPNAPNESKASIVSPQWSKEHSKGRHQNLQTKTPKTKHHDRKPFSEYLPVVTPLSKQPIDPSQGQVLEESLVLEQPISPHRGIFQDVVCEDAVPIAHSESIPSSTAIVPLNNQNVITDQSLTNSALLWVERRSFDPSRRQLEKRHSLFQNDVEESFDPRFLRKALRSVVSLPFEYFRPNSMEPVIPESPPLAPIVEEPPDGPPFQDGPPLLATLQALMKERDRQTAWIFPPDDPSGDDCSDTEYVPEDDDPLNCLVKEPAYLTDQPNSGLHKRVSIESVEKTVEETNTITLTQSGVELTISQNRKKTVKKSMERPAPTTLIDPAHVDDIEKLRHAIDPSTGMINLANVENPVWDFITVPPPDNPQEVTFEEFYGFPSRSQPVNETPVNKLKQQHPKIGQVPQEGLSLSFPTSSIMSISDEELTTLCQESDTKTLNGFKAKETIFSLPPPSKQPGQTPKAPRGSTVGTRGPLPKSKRGQPTDGPPSITPSMAGTQMPSRQDRDTNLILANLKGQTALPTVERHLLPPPLRTISNKKIDVLALDGVQYSEDLGYVFWDEDDTTKHLNAASQLLKHHFAKIAQLLAERDVSFGNVDNAVWRLSATPFVLKTKKAKKPKGEQPFQWKPPTEDVSESPRLGRAEKKKIETLVAKGKPSRALKELSKVIHPVPEIPFEDMVRIIQTLHNADDPRQLTLHDLGEPREGWDLERENVEIQLQRLNSNSTASLDGITAELLKRAAIHLKPVSALIGAVIAECLQKGFVPTAWCLVRMVGIPKAKGGLMARVLLQRNRQWFLDRIHPRQRGVGHPNGIEEIVFAVGDALDGAIAQKTNLVVAALDMSNAYQCVRRQLLIDKIVQLDHHDPQLVQFLAQAFSKEKLVLDSHGQRAVIHNTRGVQQGCPLSPALFALYLTRCIEHGLQLNPAKTVAVSILDGQISTAPFGLMGSTITPTTSMHLLGTLLTLDQNERDQMFLDKVQKSDGLLPFLGLLSHQAHLLLLRQCINVRPLHLLRTLPISGHVLRQADALLITHLLTFFHLPQSNSILIHANVEDGGLGFSSFAGSNIPSLVHAMTSRRPFLWQANPNPSGAPFQIGQEPPSSTFSPLQMVISVISMLNLDQFEKARRGQGKMIGRKIDMPRSVQVEPIFWVTMMPVDKFHVLDNDTILNSLNYRMLKEPTSYELGKTLLDKQGRNLNYSVPCPICSVQFRVDHASCCQLNGSARTARHTTIKLWLNRLLQQIPNVVTELEKPVWMDGINLGTKPRPAGAIADIRVTITTQVSNHKFVTNLLQGGDRSGNTLTFGLDLTIAQDIPNALHRGLLPDPRTAVNQAEEGKSKHYKKLGQEHKVIGIGISENGQLGNNMELFLDFMKKVARDGHKSAQVYHFLQMTSLVLEQSRCIMERQSPYQLPTLDPSEGSMVIMTSTSPEEHIVETMERDSSEHELTQSGDNDLLDAGMEVDRSDSDLPISGPNLENPQVDSKDADVGQEMIVELPPNDAEVIQDIIFGLPPTDVNVDQEPAPGLTPSDAEVGLLPIPGSTTQDAEVSQMPPPGLTLTDIDIDIEPSLEQITFGSDTLPISFTPPPSISLNPIPGSSQPTRTPQTQIPPAAVLIELDSDDDHNDLGQPQNGSKRKTFVDLTIDEEVTSHKCPPRATSHQGLSDRNASYPIQNKMTSQ